MAEPVKTTRRYESPRRREQAAATRGQILEAARRLFEEQGYPATTMAAIAAEAGVALKTVYLAFETKSGILRALWHLLLRGDEEDVPIPQRPWYQEVLDEQSPTRQLRLLAQRSRTVKQRAGGLMRVIRDAAPADPDLAALWSRIQSEFHDVQRTIVESLDRKHVLKRELDVARAADLLWMLNHPDVWQLLVHERGWSAEEWERWFETSARTQLLGARRSPS